MNDLLLDTHAWLWWLADDGRLAAVVDLISDTSRTVFVSAATIWEISIKAAIGKLKAPDSIADQIETTGFVQLPITVAHAAAVRHLPQHHRDPFDRLLIAQASIMGLAIVTHDNVFRLYDAAVVPV